VTGDEDAGVQAPACRVGAGAPTDEERAALTAVLAVLRRERGRPHVPGTSTIAGGWNSYWHTLRHPYLPGRDAWRSTFRR